MHTESRNCQFDGGGYGDSPFSKKCLCLYIVHRYVYFVHCGGGGWQVVAGCWWVLVGLMVVAVFRERV
ncbi:hypothetical protein Hanom_Chr13g01225171 [Helianthus anomalus]